jgi:hypothetical protein
LTYIAVSGCPSGIWENLYTLFNLKIVIIVKKGELNDGGKT